MGVSPSNPKKGRGTHLRLPPAPALGPTSPCRHKAVRSRGPGLQGGRLDASGAGPGDPRGSGRARHRSPASLGSRPGREGRASLLVLQGAGSSLGRPGPRAFPSKRFQRKPGATHAARLATPEVAASSVERLGRPGRGVGCGLAGARGNRSDVDESRSRRRLFAPHRSANSVPQISSPRFPKVLHSRTSVRWPNNAGAARQGGVGGSGGGAGRCGATPETLGAPSPRLPAVARTRTLSCPSAGRWPFLLQYKGSLLRSHKSRQDPLFQQPFGQIEGTQLNFQMALEA